MTTFERIKYLSDKQKISLKSLASKLGFSENYFYNMKNAKSSPSSDMLEKVADYFHVSVDYLLGREEKSEKQFSPELEEAIDHAEAFEGTPLTTQDKAILRGVIAAYLENRDDSKGK